MRKESNQFNPTTIHEFRDFFEKSKKAPYLIIGVSIPPSFWPQLMLIQQRLKAIDNNHLYYPPQMWHITLKELGWLDETITTSTLTWVYKQLEDVCIKFKPFNVKIKGLSHFSDAIFCKIQNQDPIKELHLELINRLKEKVNISEFEGTQFVAHISLLYFASKEAGKLLNKIKQLSEVEIGEMSVTSLCVAYGYPHLLLNRSEEQRSKALLCVKKFKLGNKSWILKSSVNMKKGSFR